MPESNAAASVTCGAVHPHPQVHVTCIGEEPHENGLHVWAWGGTAIYWPAEGATPLAAGLIDDFNASAREQVEWERKHGAPRGWQQDGHGQAGEPRD